LSIENSGSTEPIFTPFSPYGRYLIVNCRFDPPFSDGSRYVAIATNLGSKLAKSDYLPLFVALTFRTGLHSIAILILKGSYVMTYLHHNYVKIW